MALRGKVVTIMALPVIVLVASASLAFLAERHSGATLEATQRAYAMQHQTDIVLTDLLDAETGTRGFLLTGDPAYLAPYQRGAAAVRGDLTQLTTLTPGDPVQAARVQRLQYLTTDRLTVMVNLQALVPVTGNTDRGSMARILDEGKKLMDTIRSVLSDMSTQVTASIRREQAGLDRARHLAFLLAVLGTPGAVLLALGFVFFSAERMVSRIARIEENARRMERGEALEDPGRNPDEIGELGRVLVETGARLSDLQGELRNLATVDELTGIANRRGFLTVAEHQLRLSARVGEPVVLMFLDIDGLKPVNDTHGHATGDQMLRETAEVLVSTFRDADLIARVGGDEFCVLLTTSEDPGARIALQRLREVAARRSLEPGRAYGLSFSVGVTEFDPNDPATVQELMDSADRLMYAEKGAKREAATIPGEPRSEGRDIDPSLPLGRPQGVTR